MRGERRDKTQERGDRGHKSKRGEKTVRVAKEIGDMIGDRRDGGYK